MKTSPVPEVSSQSVEQTLRELTIGECQKAVGAASWPNFLHPFARLPFEGMAQRLARNLAGFDAALGKKPLPDAAGAVLGALGVVPTVRHAAPFNRSGPLLVVANHPGVYDALTLFAAIGRQDLRVIAAEREFLRALPNMHAHLLFVDDSVMQSTAGTATQPIESRGRGLRQALRHLRAQGCLLHFAAGSIEPDPAFVSPERAIGRWQHGVGALAAACQRLGGEVRLGLVSGVHSARLKNSPLMRAIEKRGAATVAGLLQVAFPSRLPVSPEVLISGPLDTLPNDASSATSALERQAKHLLLTHKG